MDPRTPNQIVADNIWRLRKQRGWKQSDLALRVNERFLGERKWTTSTVSDVEGGRRDRQRTLDADELVVLARVFEISLVTLLTPERGVEARIGPAVLSAEDYFLLTFHLPPKYTYSFFPQRVGSAEKRDTYLGEVAGRSSPYFKEMVEKHMDELTAASSREEKREILTSAFQADFRERLKSGDTAILEFISERLTETAYEEAEEEIHE